jgi:hypothetical protein
MKMRRFYTILFSLYSVDGLVMWMMINKYTNAIFEACLCHLRIACNF